MTQGPQKQSANPEVASPEQRGMLGRATDFVRSTPWVMGTEMAAQDAADKLPTRNEALAMGATAVLALGVGANTASAKKVETEPPVGPQPVAGVSNWEPSPAEAAEFCKDTTLDPPTVGFRYVWRKNKKGERVPTRTMIINIKDNNPNPGIITRDCSDQEAKPREFHVMPQIKRTGQKGKSRNNARKATVVRIADGKKIGTSAFFKRFRVKLKRAHVPGKTQSQVRVKETYFPNSGPPVSEVTVHKNLRAEKIPVTKEPI